MRFFLDSNVLVSGIAFPGNERWLLRRTFGGRHAFVISEDVRQETLDTLRQKFPRLKPEAEEALTLVRVEVVPASAYRERLGDFPALRDPHDAHVLGAAVVSQCDAIVTGDRDLLVLGEASGVRILRPVEARRIIAASDEGRL